MPNYYLHKEGEIHGPFPMEEMKRLIARGEVGHRELICPEGGTEWVAASILAAPAAPAATLLGNYQSSTMTASIERTTRQHVQDEYQKLKFPGLGILFSAALPVILWAAKSDAQNGVGVSGSRQGLKTLAQENFNLLPLAIVVGVIGVAICSIWFHKTLKRARLVKASYDYKHR